MTAARRSQRNNGSSRTLVLMATMRSSANDSQDQTISRAHLRQENPTSASDRPRFSRIHGVPTGTRQLFRDASGSERSARRHGIASAHAICPSKPSDCRHLAVAIPIVAVGVLVTTSPCQQCAQPQQPDFAYHQSLVAWRGRQSVDRGLGFGHVTVGTALQQCLHQNTGRRNAPPSSRPARNKWSTAARITGIAASRSPRLALSRAMYTSMIGKHAQVVSARAGTLSRTSASSFCPRSRSAGQSRCTSAMAQREPGVGQREIITGSLGDP